MWYTNLQHLGRLFVCDFDRRAVVNLYKFSSRSWNAYIDSGLYSQGLLTSDRISDCFDSDDLGPLRGNIIHCANTASHVLYDRKCCDHPNICRSRRLLRDSSQQSSGMWAKILHFRHDAFLLKFACSSRLMDAALRDSSKHIGVIHCRNL